MGIQLTQLVSGETIGLEDMFGKVVAIDAFNWIYQFLSIIRQPDGTPLQDSHGRVTSHLSGLYYRTLKLMEAGVKPVYVFDGKPPDFKAVGQRRHDVRAEAAAEWKAALERQDIEAASRHAKRSTTINSEHIEGSKKLLEAMGLPFVQAPSEGEAMCAHLVKQRDAYAAASQDYDTLLFGAAKLVRNLSITGKKKRRVAGRAVGTSSAFEIVMIYPEMLSLDGLLRNLDISHDQLIMLGILIGTDFNPGGVAGLGPKKALARVREKKTMELIFADVKWDFPVSPEQIFDFFKNPPTSEYKLDFREPSQEKIVKMMCDEHDFSEERVANALKKAVESRKDQSTLSRWIR
ncbi:MAG: flap endonuclease-1 [Candidatus Aenigmarchaeota archaeon]|nr:flap endonuclease-1 [Candidatus Aenigmarchaeota archaeon]